MQSIDKASNWIQQELGITVKSMKRLAGGTSSLLYEVETENSFIVLRQIDHAEWLREEPDLVRHEAASLQKASASNISVPLLLSSDETGEASGFPSILMSKVEGKVVLEPDDFHVWTDGLAKSLAEIHQVEAGDFPWKYAAYIKREDIKLPKWTKKPDIWQVALKRFREPVPEFQETFIHRDFHPANVLWKYGEVSGVVDWPNACRGPVGIDVGHCRVNLALLHGVGVADLFLKAYRLHAKEFIPNAYFDIVAIFDSLEGPPTVYKGWTDLGVKGLTNELMDERMDAFMESVIRGN